MTDKEKLKALLTEFGIEFEEEPNLITCTEGNRKVTGYGGFFTIFEFNEDGTFIQMGAGE